MLKRSVRGWQVAAGVLIAIAVAGIAGIAIYMTRRLPADAASMAAYFPGREATVAYLDVAAMRSSGLLDRILGSTVGEEPEYKAFLEQTGFDYKRDMDRVMLNSAGGIHYFLVQGRFDWNKLRAYAHKTGGGCKGQECWTKGSTPDRVISFRPLGRNLMALASAKDDAGARAIDRRAPEKPPFAIPSHPLWVHVPVQAIAGATQLPAGTKLFAKALQGGERVIFALGPSENKFELTMDVVCRNPEDAAIMKAQLEGLTKLLSSLIVREKQAANPNDLSGVLTSGSFDRVESRVIGKWRIERAFLESLGGS